MANSNDKQKKIWDNFIEVGEVRKSDGIKFVIAAATRDGFRYVNIREFYMRKRDGIWMPGRDGITIPLKATLNKGAEFIEPAEAMINIITEAMNYAQKMDLADDSRAVYMPVKEKQQ